MKFEPANLYHVYNRGINRQNIFFKEVNYLYFLKKLEKYICPYCDLLAYCLMPNHFHFLIHADERSITPVNTNALITRTALSDGLRLLLSSYAKGINVQEARVGNLFQQKTKAKIIDMANIMEETSNSQPTRNYAEQCFHYIHQNPLRAGLVSNMEDWQWSSFADYAGISNGNLCNKELAVQLLGLDLPAFYADSYSAVPENLIGNFY